MRIVHIEDEDYEFIYDQLILRRNYLEERLDIESRSNDTAELSICLRGIERIERVTDEMGKRLSKEAVKLG